MHFLSGKRTGLSAATGANHRSRLIEAPPTAVSCGTGQPCLITLKLLARSCGGKMVGHPLTKAVAGPMMFLGARIDCLGMDNDWFGDYAALVAACGSGLFVLSTIVSTYNKPIYEPLAKHLAQSIGYCVAGGPLAIVQLGTWLLCKKSAQEFDAEQIAHQIVPEWDPVLDGPDNEFDSPVNVQLSADTPASISGAH